MASPHVAGAAALYKSTHAATPLQVLAALQSSGSTSASDCVASNNNGFGYFTGDKDAFKEPLVSVRNY